MHERTVPIVVDADTGYGNALNVHRYIHELIAAGAASARKALAYFNRSPS